MLVLSEREGTEAGQSTQKRSRIRRGGFETRPLGSSCQPGNHWARKFAQPVAMDDFDAKEFAEKTQEYQKIFLK